MGKGKDDRAPLMVKDKTTKTNKIYSVYTP